MSKHTPGPWRVTGKYRIDAPTQINELPRCVGQAVQGHGVTLDDLQANADIMAAAPELLAAVKVAREFFINPHKFNPIDVEKMYDAAIRKAGGWS